MKVLKNIVPKNIIVRMPNWVGDVVMGLAVLSDLKRSYPHSNLIVLAQEKVCELLKTNKDIDKLISFKKQKNIFFKRKENKKLIEDLKKLKCDVGILLTNSFSSAYLFYKAKIKNIIGYKKDLRSFFLNYPMRVPKEKIHQITKYKNLLRSLNISISNTKPKLYVDEEEIKKVKDILYQKGFKKDNILIGINPLAKYGMAKCWPSIRFEAVAKKLSENKNYTLVFIGDSSSKDLIDKICENLPENVINLAGNTTLRQLTCIIHECDLFLTNDSGPMHLASALDIPLIALFGSTSDIITGPYSEKAIVINKKVCSPCFKRKCPSDFKCMNQITVEEVLDKINKALKENDKKN